MTLKNNNNLITVKTLLHEYNIDYNNEDKTISLLANIHTEIHLIMNNTNIDNLEKQQQLENLKHYFIKKQNQLNFSIPKQIYDVILAIENLYTVNDYTELYTKMFENNSEIKPRISQKRKIFLIKWYNLIKFLKDNHENLALHIVYNSIRLIQSAFFKNIEYTPLDDLKTIPDKTHEFLKQMLDKNKTLCFKKTNFIASIRKNLLETILLLDITSLTNEEKENNNMISPSMTDSFLNYTDDEIYFIDELISFYLEKVNFIHLKDNKIVIDKDNTFATRYYYQVDDSIITYISSMQCYSPSIPFISKPKDWFFNEKTKKMNWGGFHVNKKGIYPGVHAKSKQSVTITTKKYIEAINYLQSIKLTINNQSLDYLCNNLYNCLNNFLYDRHGELFKNILEYNTNGNINKILSWTEYMSLEIKLHENKPWAADFILSLKERYNNMFASICEFFHILFLAKQFKDKIIYFSYFLDVRGRIYETTSYGLSPQGNSLSRFLLCLYDNNTNENFNLENLQTFNIFNNNILINHNTYGIDVSCSGLQIIGGLTLNLNILEDTNFIIKKDEINNQVKSIYSKLLEGILNDLKNENLLNALKCDFNIITPDILKDLYLIIDRDFIKKWTIKYIYSEGNYSRSNSVITRAKELKLEVFLSQDKAKQAYCGYFLSNLFIRQIDFQYPAATIFSKEIQALFRKKAIDSKNKSKTIIIGTSLSNDELSTVMSFGKIETKQIRIYSSNFQKALQISVQYESNKIDTVKVKQSITPHLIHHLDSKILYKVILKAKENNIPLYTIHDCFYVKKKHIELIKQFYFDTFKDVIINDNAYKNILILNEIEHEITIKDIDRKLFLDLLETEYQMSPFILKK